MYGKTGAACQQDCEYTKADNDTLYINQCVGQLEHVVECIDKLSNEFLKNKIESELVYKGKRYVHVDSLHSIMDKITVDIRNLITDKIEIIKDI